ncbi:MAG: hypothetical protein WCG08_14180, partial [Paludibacter sp.]
ATESDLRRSKVKVAAERVMLRQIVACTDKESLSKAGTPIRQRRRVLPIHRTKSRTGTSLH